MTKAPTPCGEGAQGLKALRVSRPKGTACVVQASGGGRLCARGSVSKVNSRVSSTLTTAASKGRKNSIMGIP